MTTVDMERWLEQNEIAARGLTEDEVRAAEDFAEHHAGGLFVLGCYVDGKPELYVKMHDSWGDEDKVVVHVYHHDDMTGRCQSHEGAHTYRADPDPCIGWDVTDAEHYYDTGSEALAHFLRLVGEA